MTERNSLGNLFSSIIGGIRKNSHGTSRTTFSGEEVTYKKGFPSSSSKKVSGDRKHPSSRSLENFSITRNDPHSNKLTLRPSSSSGSLRVKQKVKRKLSDPLSEISKCTDTFERKIDDFCDNHDDDYYIEQRVSFINNTDPQEILSFLSNYFLSSYQEQESGTSKIYSKDGLLIYVEIWSNGPNFDEDGQPRLQGRIKCNSSIRRSRIDTLERLSYQVTLIKDIKIIINENDCEILDSSDYDLFFRKNL